MYLIRIFIGGVIIACLAISSAHTGDFPGPANFSPFFTVESQIELSDQEQIVMPETTGAPYYIGLDYYDIKNAGMAMGGLTIHTPYLFGTIALGIPWSDRDGYFTPCLDIGAGFKYKGLVAYGGILRDIKNDCEYQIADADYVGLKYLLNISDLTLENGIQYKEAFFEFNSSGARMYDFNYTARLILNYKIFYPYISFSVDKWNTRDDPAFSIGLGLTIGLSNVHHCQSPRQVSISTTNTNGDVVRKPNIYLYPEKTGPVEVKIFPNGRIEKSIPEYIDGWTVTASPDGAIERTEGYLFYEAIVDYKTPTEGWCIRTDNIFPFLNKILRQYGFNDREIDDFMAYWSKNLSLKTDYMVIRPLINKAIDRICPLKISPVPDQILRLWFIFKPSTEFVDIREPEIKPFARTGFTVTEWGGIVE